MEEKDIYDNAEFLADFAYQVTTVALAADDSKAEVIESFVAFLARSCFTYAVTYRNEQKSDAPQK